ncbi:MAG: RNA methyltransferase [Simkaniaceae bacterium]|nr:RNA methyltransferase [Simkaniaceae bacterium]
MMREKITSFGNPCVKATAGLRNKRERDGRGHFLVEGYRELLRATEGEVSFHTLLYSPSHFLGVNEEMLIRKIEATGARIAEVDRRIFDKLSYRDRPDGLLGIAIREERTLESVELGHNPFILVAEGIEKPGNLGAILRSCDATGVDVLFVCDGRTDIRNPNVVRASVGTLFTVPVVELRNDEALRYLRERGIPLFASSPGGGLLYTEADHTGPVALAVGTEQTGLSSGWMERATETIRIPMAGAADSLNVAAATTLLLYEVLRQRSIAKKGR